MEEFCRSQCCPGAPGVAVETGQQRWKGASGRGEGGGGGRGPHLVVGDFYRLEVVPPRCLATLLLLLVGPEGLGRVPSQQLHGNGAELGGACHGRLHDAQLGPGAGEVPLCEKPLSGRGEEGLFGGEVLRGQRPVEGLLG